jgi:putative nucleotidyltransferase with HDIG domain
MLAQITDLKPLPTTVVSVIKLIEEPDVSMHELAATILTDQALTARMLKVVNSPHYRFTYPATTIHEAVTRLGFQRIKRIFFTLSYGSVLGKRVASYNLGHNELWRHSTAVATTAQWLSDRVGYQAPDEAYIGGLLHDIGKLVLDQYFKVDWEYLLNEGQTYNHTLLETEERLFNLNHALVGGEVARKWQLPECLIDAIRHHHNPASASKSPLLTAIVHIADVICLRLGIGLSHISFLPLPSEDALDLLSLSSVEVDFLTESYREGLVENLWNYTDLLSISNE